MKAIKLNMGRTNWKLFFLLFLCIALNQGCTEDIRASFREKPNALGVTSEIVVVADNDLWEGAIGDSIRFYFGGAYPLLPQPEPMYDLRHFTPEELDAEPLRKELRTFLIVGDLSATDSKTNVLIAADLGKEKIRKAKEDPTYFSTVGRDRWASGQLVVYIFGKDESSLGNNIVRSFSAVAKRINQHDYRQMDANVFIEDENKEINAKIKEKFNFDIRIPGEYEIARSGNNFLWLRKDAPSINSSLMISELPYTSQSQFTKENILSVIDSLGKRFISTDQPGSFMQTATDNLPAFVYKKEIDGKYTLEARGLWEINNAFMGGPFSAYMILDDSNNRIIFINGFVYAPGKEKRMFVQAIEHIVGTLKFAPLK